MKNRIQRKILFFQKIQFYVKRVNKEKEREEYKNTRYRRRFKKFILVIILVHLVGILFNNLSFKYEFWDNDVSRGAIAADEALFDEVHEKPVYLKQGWTNKDSLWFYKTTQGSDLMPYDFYMALEQVNSKSLFRLPSNLQKYQFLTQKATFSNPDALPVGFAKDSYKGKEYIGFTCAGCHTSQINYSDKNDVKQAIRIDGAPAQADLETFMLDLSQALQSTLCDKSLEQPCDEAKQNRFIDRVLDRNGTMKVLTGGRNYTSEQEVLNELEVVTNKLITYNWINRPDTSYGYSRLDAFGRIYNRVLKHVIDEKTMKITLSEFLSDRVEVEKILDAVKATSNEGKHLVDATLTHLSYEQKEAFLSHLFKPANAPVSYPYLWDIPYHDYLQWNGMVNNAGAGALGRNVGQVIGVFGTLDWNKTDDFSPSNFLIENKSLLNSVNFHSSINMRNISRVETQIKKLRSPVWPEDKLGNIDKDKSARGKIIFKNYCQACHGNINRSDPQRRITAHISSIKNIGTDPTMAANSISRSGYTGLLQGSYVDIPVGKILLQETAPVALMVTIATENILKTADFDSNIFVRWSDWIYDMFFVLIENPVEDTLKKGDYTPDTTVNPFASLLSYKARSLNGIWATAPYLHNGSVPTLYDLLLPKKKEDSAETGEYRPDIFIVGSRIFESKKVGFKSEDYDGFVFDTNHKGNHNTGHEYAAGNTALPNGKKMPPLNETQRYDLVEYLKTL